jgi:hypothetical protein
MRIYIDIDTRRILTTATRPATRLEFKRRDNDAFEVQFLRAGAVQSLPVGTIARVGVKATEDFAGEFLATDTLSVLGTGAETVYTGSFNLNTTALEALFPEEPASITAMLEVQWVSGTSVGSSLTLPITIFNDVIRGDEGAPADLPLFYTSSTPNFLATQAEAEAGSDNTKWMSPLRVAQAIEELGGGGGVSSWNDLTDKPSTFPPATHTHAIADTTGLQTALDGKAATSHTHPLSALTQSSATSGQVATWSGTAWVPQTPSGGGVTSYNDLDDIPSTFPPEAHTHAIGDIDYLQDALDGKAETSHTHAIADTTGLQTALNGKAATSHTHAASDITSGTLANARTTATSANTASAIVARDASGNFSAGTITANLTGTASGNAPATGIAQSAVTNLTTDLAGKAASSHTHAATDITSGTLAIARIPTGTTSTTVALGNDSRFSDSRTPTSHTHGNITNAGSIGTTATLPIITGTSGVLQAGSFGTTAGTFAQGNHTHTFGTTAGTFCQGNDSRLLTITGGITAIAVVATMPVTPVATTLYIVTE